jgi:hypothetical protein
MGPRPQGATQLSLYGVQSSDAMDVRNAQKSAHVATPLVLASSGPMAFWKVRTTNVSS